MSSSFKWMIIFLLTVHCAIGQEQNNRWYFGYNNGVNFNTAPPTALNGGQTFTQEGTASIADRLTGNLLFYTDGARVWDRNNVIMPNGTGLLGGIDNISNVPNDLSSTSAAIIVPRPFNPNIYYIITIDQVNSTNGMRYTVVDMSLNGGFGDVVPGQKNILILNTRSEKMQAVPQANGCGYWLITTDSNGTQFLSYSITETGIDATPVVSPMAPGADFIERGHIKINSQLDKLALGNNVGFSNIPRIELYDFDNATGLISNPITWNYPFTLFNSFAGVEFSPDGTKLYISPGFIGIVQYDISSGNQATIEASFFDVTQSFGTPVTGTIQLGPNGIIYAATSSGLLSINNPNASGAACNPIANPISGLTGQTWYGLPQKVYVLDDPNISNDIVTNGNCTANAIPFSLQNTNDVQSVVWDFDDPSTGAQNTSTSLAPSHTFSAPGTYNVEVEVTYPCTIITFTTEVNIVSPTAPTFSIPNTLCTGAVAPALPVTSDNGINGTWSPATVDNTASGTYTFTPASGQCATTFDLNVTVESTILQNGFEFAYSITKTTFDRRIEVRVSGEGDFSFQLNNNLVQDSPIFNDVQPGLNIISVYFNGACSAALSSKDIFILEYPNFFTSNGDGVNDFWNIPDLAFEPNAQILIFDRYGKFLTQISPLDQGWDGTLNNRELPSSDYWFSTFYNRNGSIENLKGHFSLKR